MLIGKMIPEWIAQGAKPVVATAGEPGDWSSGAPVFRIAPPTPPGAAGGNALVRRSRRARREGAILGSLLNMVEIHRSNLIFSFSNPQESNVLGARLSRATDIPFISHFSDPWVDNPFKRYGLLRNLSLRRQESGVVKQSQRVIFTNEQAQHLVMAKYPVALRQRGIVVPHCFDPRLYLGSEPRQDRFVISYIGALYGDRNPRPLLAALARLLGADADLRQKCLVRFVGATDEGGSFRDRDLARLIAEHGLEGVVSSEPKVQYAESLRLMRASQCLVVIDADFPGSPFLPSKVVDYAGSRRPIVGITPADSPTAQFLRRLGYRAFAHSDIDGLAAYMRELIVTGTALAPDEAVLREYEVSSTTARLLSVFREVVQAAAISGR
jgi:glycosyltransferase involved in cell wall biosynthesis